MKKIILASASPQRKNLMDMLGLKYSIIPSKADEIQKITTTCADLVKKNALLKAEDVASRQKDAIVIGSDTVVYIGNKTMVGKPKSIKEAKERLKHLMAHPHWVYSGVAVIDVAKRRRLVDYEKTKIFMTPLSDEEIDRYYRHMSPLDKAGGFDIEGKGSIFIRRIEGCYFNVVGLPIAKLCTMLKKFGVQVLSLFIVAMLTGCATEFNTATGRQESLMYGSDKEKSIGDAIASQLEKQVTLVHEPAQVERVETILAKIVGVCDRKDITYTIKIIDEDKLNAVSLPGGYIYIFKGILDKAENDDQVAGVVAHEVGHITAKHSIKRLQAMYGYTLLQILSIGSGNMRAAQGIDLALTSIFLEYARDDEFEADRLAVKYMKLAGYNAEEMAGFLAIMKAQQDKEPARPYSYWRTHPYLTQRIAVVNKEATGELRFRDYLNLTGEE